MKSEIKNVDDLTRLIAVYMHEVDGHPAIGYAQSYLTLSDFEKLQVMLFAQEQIGNETNRVMEHLNEKQI